MSKNNSHAGDISDGSDRLRHSLGDATPLPSAGQERRLAVIAQDYWQSLVQPGKGQPYFAELSPEGLRTFRDNALLLAVDPASDDAAKDFIIRFAGDALSQLIGCSLTVGERVSDHLDCRYVQGLTARLQRPPAIVAPETFEYLAGKVESRGIILPFLGANEQVGFYLFVATGRVVTAALITSEALRVLGGDDGGADGPTPPPAAEAETSPETQQETTPENPQESPQESPPAPPASSAADPDASKGPGPADGPSQPAFAQHLEQAQSDARNLPAAGKSARDALYGLLAEAYALHEASQADKAGYAALLAEAGLRGQARAPFTPILKLVFGADYDKTRLTEYAAALSYAKRCGIETAQLAAFLRNMDGGIKACVQLERAARRGSEITPAALRRRSDRQALKKARSSKLKSLKIQDDFALVLVRRGKKGTAEVLGPVTASDSTLNSAIKQVAASIEASFGAQEDGAD